MATRIDIGPEHKIISERPQIISGEIVRQDGQFRAYTAVFTGCDQAWDPDDLTPETLLGTTMEVPYLPASETDRFFTIVGGYFFDMPDSDTKRVTRIFGVAADPTKGFNFTEGGSQLLVDEWELAKEDGNTRTVQLDEFRRARQNHTSTLKFGWTLIMEEVKAKELVPKGERGLEFFKLCPELATLVATEGQQTKNTQVMRFEAQMDLDLPEGASLTWDWGDGSEPSITTTTSTTHRYSRPEGADQTFSVTVSYTTPTGCQDSLSQDVLIPQKCPVAKTLTVTVDQTDQTTLTATFSATLEGQSQPESYQWQWGEEEPVITELPTLTQTFPRPQGNAETLTITLTLLGPDPCNSTKTVDLSVPALCPVLESLVADEGVETEAEITYTFTVSYQNSPADQTEWQVGNISETTTDHTWTRSFPKVAGQDTTVEVSAKGVGPGDCITGTSTVTVAIPKQCPSLTGIGVTMGTPSPDQQEVSFEAQVEGPAPTSFSWLIGEQSISTEGPTLVHLFDRPIGEDLAVTVSVQSQGPGTCDGSTAETSITIERKCPELTGISADLAELEETTQSITFTAQIEGPQPDSFTWTWENETRTTTTPELTEIFQRPFGTDTTLDVSVTSQGPGTCSSAPQSTQVTIPHICPTLTGIETLNLQVGENALTATFKATFEGPQPTTFRWAIGTEIVETSTPDLARSFPRPIGDGVQVQISVSSIGPGECADGPQQTTVEVPGICPEITGLTPTPAPPGELTQVIQFVVSTAKATPIRYIWDWGEGTTETTSSPTASHEFPRLPGDPRSVKVTVTTEGPGQCTASAETFVAIPGLCPEVSQFTLDLGVTTATHQPVQANLTLVKAQGTRYVWNWGDGTPEEETQTPQASHSYERKPGNAKPYTVNVRIEGPGGCLTPASAQVSVPGICPEIQSVVLQYDLPTDTQQGVTALVETGEVGATHYEWDWGDGSPATTTTQKQALHQYNRQPGDALNYSITVTAVGPDDCRTSAQGTAQVPGICPEIVSITPTTISLDANGLGQSFAVQVLKTQATSYVWDFGDGTPQEETTAPHNTHIFVRTPGEDRNYLVRVRAAGPGSCDSSAVVQVQVPAICPLVSDIDIQYTDLTDTSQGVSVSLVMAQADATSYTWTWADGTIETTEVPQATHTYQRLPGDAKHYQVMVVANGPGTCETKANLQIRVPGICPKILGFTTSLESSPDHTAQVVRATLEVDYPDGVSYEWHWDDGSENVTTLLPEATHTYTRHPGDPRSHTLVVTLKGPESCECTSATLVVIPGYCPELSQAVANMGELKDGSQEVSVSLEFAKGNPDEISWDWGDGSLVESTDGNTLTLTHIYTRLPGDARDYSIDIQTTGPGETCGLEHSLSVQIPGICPEAVSLTIDREEDLSETERQVFALLEVARTSADTYKWNWGDGSPVTETSSPDAAHVYDRLPGDGRTYTIEVSLEGPDSCESQLSLEHFIPGICPRLETIVPTYETPTESVQTVHLAVTTELADPESFEWDWGDGSAPQVTTTAYASYDYARLAGDDLPYTVTVRLIGPESCDSQGTVEVLIPGICPEIEEVTVALGSQTYEYQEVSAEVITRLATPEKYIWDWGDGSPIEETETPTHTHSYARFAGDDRPYVIQVSTSGPGTSGKCDTHEAVDVLIPGFCPELTGFEVVTNPVADEKTQLVTVTAQVDLAPADSYTWDWGDGSPVEHTTEPTASHVYTRLPGAARTLTIGLTLSGPDQCNSTGSTEVEIEGLCPALLGWESSLSTQTATSVTYGVQLEVEDEHLIVPGTFTYKWTWGDGQTSETTEPYVEHTFERLGVDTVFQVEFEMQGPGACNRKGCIRVKVEGTCPVLQGVETDFCSLTDTSASIHFHAAFRPFPFDQDMPTEYIWYWGDGSPATITTTPYASHKFERSLDSSLTYEVKVVAKGGDCDCETQYTVAVQLPGTCPLLTDIRAIYGAQTEESQQVTLVALTRGGKPRQYEWDLGDGSPIVRTPSGTLAHTYARTQERYRVRVSIVGRSDSYAGKNCSHQLTSDIEIDLPEPTPSLATA